MKTTVALFFLGVTAISAQNVATGSARGSINLQHVPSSMAYHRVWAVTPLIGTPGKQSDPLRPVFVAAPPTPQQGAPSTAPPSGPANRAGVLGYQMQLSDDGQFALVEYVFQSPAAFQAVLQQEAATRGIAVNPTATRPPSAPGLASASPAQIALEAGVPGLKIFERGKATDAEILAEFQKYKTNFAFGAATVRAR